MVVNSVSFGLLSVDEWRDNIVNAAKGQIQKFKLTPQQNADLKKEIEVILNGVIDKAAATINKPQKSVGGKIKKLAFDALVSEKKLHEEVPGYSQKIIDEVNKPSSYSRLKRIAQTELDSLGSQTYDSSKNAETVIMDSIFKKYNAANKESFENQTNADLSLIRKQILFLGHGHAGRHSPDFVHLVAVRNKEEVDAPLYIL